MYTEAIRENTTNIITVQDAVGVPDKYQSWIEARGHFIGNVLMRHVGRMLRGVTTSSVDISERFHKALGLPFQLHEVEDYSRESIQEIIDKQEGEVVIFPYRASNGVAEIMKTDQSKVEVIGNSERISQFDKTKLHPQKPREGLVELNLGGTDIPVLPGYTCKSIEDIRKAAEVLGDGQYIFKDAVGTDGNNITFDIGEAIGLIEGGKTLVAEKRVKFKETISVQYIGGQVLGVLKENEKDDENTWGGNSHDEEFQKSERVEDLTRYAHEFAGLMKDIYGEDVIIFGLDFGVYDEVQGDGSVVEKIALIDPNVRMPGNMFMYYMKAALENRGFTVPAMRSVLLYADEVYAGSGIELQDAFHAEGISLISEGNGQYSINTSQESIPRGATVIVQDSGDTMSGPKEKLTMLQFFGDSQEDIDDQIVIAKRIIRDQRMSEVA